MLLERIVEHLREELVEVAVGELVAQVAAELVELRLELPGEPDPPLPAVARDGLDRAAGQRARREGDEWRRGRGSRRLGNRERLSWMCNEWVVPVRRRRQYRGDHWRRPRDGGRKPPEPIRRNLLRLNRDGQLLRLRLGEVRGPNDEVVDVLWGEDRRQDDELSGVQPSVFERGLQDREPTDEPQGIDPRPCGALRQMKLADEVLEGRAAVEGGVGVFPVEDVEVAEEADEGLPLVDDQGAEGGVEGLEGGVVHGSPPVLMRTHVQ
jgi:hypothetical protein